MALLLGFALAIVGGIAAAGSQPVAPQQPLAVLGFVIPFVIVYALGFAGLQAYVRVREANTALDHTAFDQFQLHSDMRVRDVALLYLTNGLAVIASFGLATPWAMCRMWRYWTDNLSLVGTGELQQFVAAQDSQAMSAAADIAVDLGLEF